MIFRDKVQYRECDWYLVRYANTSKREEDSQLTIDAGSNGLVVLKDSLLRMSCERGWAVHASQWAPAGRLERSGKYKPVGIWDTTIIDFLTFFITQIWLYVLFMVQPQHGNLKRLRAQWLKTSQWSVGAICQSSCYSCFYVQLPYLQHCFMIIM